MDCNDCVNYIDNVFHKKSETYDKIFSHAVFKDLCICFIFPLSLFTAFISLHNQL